MAKVNNNTFWSMVTLIEKMDLCAPNPQAFQNMNATLKHLREGNYSASEAYTLSWLLSSRVKKFFDTTIKPK